MKAVAAIMVSLAPLVLASVSLGEDLPKPQRFARYEAMMNKNPFVVATTVPPQRTQSARDLYIVTIAKSDDGVVVTLGSTIDSNFREYLSTKRPSQDGWRILKIEWPDPEVLATKAAAPVNK